MSTFSNDTGTVNIDFSFLFDLRTTPILKITDTSTYSAEQTDVKVLALKLEQLMVTQASIQDDEEDETEYFYYINTQISGVFSGRSRNRAEAKMLALKNCREGGGGFDCKEDNLRTIRSMGLGRERFGQLIKITLFPENEFTIKLT